jgi:hypothetical protein
MSATNAFPPPGPPGLAYPATQAQMQGSPGITIEMRPVTGEVPGVSVARPTEMLPPAFTGKFTDDICSCCSDGPGCKLCSLHSSILFPFCAGCLSVAFPPYRFAKTISAARLSTRSCAFCTRARQLQLILLSGMIMIPWMVVLFGYYVLFVGIICLVLLLACIIVAFVSL